MPLGVNGQLGLRGIGQECALLQRSRGEFFMHYFITGATGFIGKRLVKTPPNKVL